MDGRNFLSLTLLLPFVLGALGLAVPPLKFFTLAIIVGGVPYCIVLVATLCLIQSARATGRLVVVTLTAPPAFAVLEVAYWVLLSSSPAGPTRSLAAWAALLSPVAVVSLVTGYAFVAVAWGSWGVARRFDLVRRDFPSTDAPSAKQPNGHEY